MKRDALIVCVLILASHFFGTPIASAGSPSPQNQVGVTQRQTVFSYYQGFPWTPASTQVTLENDSKVDFHWTIATSTPQGLKVSPTTGVTGSGGGTSTLTVTVDPTGLSLGTYAGSIEISGASFSTLTETYTLNISPATVASIVADTTGLEVYTGDTGLIHALIQVQQWNGTALVPATQPWTLTPTVTWLAPNVYSGSTSTAATIAVQPSGLDNGQYGGSVVLKSPTGSFPSQTVGIGLFYRSHAACSSPSSIAITLAQGSSSACQPVTFYAIDTQAFTGTIGTPINFGGYQTLSITGSWLSTDLVMDGGCPCHSGNALSFHACATATGLSPGVYKGAINLAVPKQDSNMTVNVQFTVTPAPAIKLSSSALNFTTVSGTDAAPQTVTITNSGGGTLGWSSSNTVPSGSSVWWTYSPFTGGTNSTTVTIQPHSAALPPGTYTGSILISEPDAVPNTPSEIKMTLTVVPQAVMALDTTTIGFTSAGGVNPPSQTFQVKNSGTGALGWTAIATTQSGGNWLAVSPSSGVAPSTVTLSTNTGGLTPGIYKGNVTVTALASANAANGPQNVIVTLIVGGPLIAASGFVNAASFAQNLSPGALVSIFGTGMASGTASPAGGFPLPSILNGTQVLVNGTAAPLFFVSPTQINYQMPMEASAPASVAVASAGSTSSPVSLNLSPAAPGIFTSTGSQASALNADFSTNSPSNPAATGTYVQVFVTGLGITDPPLATGLPGNLTAPLNQTVVTPTATVGFVSAPVLFSGAAPGFIGLYQCNVAIPGGVATGDAVPVIITAAGKSSNTATIAIR
jgi:uncharacterized protein (TIGR03437 family)